MKIQIQTHGTVVIRKQAVWDHGLCSCLFIHCAHVFMFSEGITMCIQSDE